MLKIKKDSKIHNTKTNDHRDFWLAPFEREQGRIHGNPVADSLARAVRKPLRTQKCDLPTFRPTDSASSRVACPRLKTDRETGRQKEGNNEGPSGKTFKT